MSEWIPGPLEGNPFEYAEDATSSTSLSGTEAFETGIEKRDGNFCVVCGFSDPQALDYCHIIPKVEDETVRYKLLFYHIGIDLGTVGGNEDFWFCASICKGCGARRSKWHSFVREPLPPIRKAFLLYTLDA